GYTSEDLKDPEILHKVLPDDAFTENLQAIINNRDEEFFIITRDGKEVCTIWNTSLMIVRKTRRSEQMIMMSIGTNLTEHHRMQNELVEFSNKLKESERKYSLSMDLSEIGLLLKEKGSSRFYATERLCNMLGLTADSDYIDGTDLRAAIHPKDRVIFDSFSNASEKKSGSEIHSVEFRAAAADGTYHWYNFRYKSVSEISGYSMGGAVIDISADKEKDLVIERMAYYDDITQIYNRNKFMITGNELLACITEEPSLNYWVIVLDIDSFHIINDTCGYVNGNILLKEVAATLTANISEGGFAARIGGDNFAIIVKCDGDENYPVRLIKHIQRDIARISSEELKNQNITCSAGYCLMTDGGGTEFSQVLDRAEFALSLSDGRRSTINRFDNHAHDSIIAGNELEKNLMKALDNNELVLYYQPKINLENGKVIGMEALIRWIKPDGTIIPPSEFIPVAESSMLITKISKFVLHEACRQNKEWQDMGLDPITVSINLTAIDFYQTNVTESIKNALSDTGLDAKWLDVELTESLALKDIDHAVKQMKEIKELGVKLSMDDFGTGYSSLSYIQILPITLLKLDRSFIMYLEEDEISREIVSAVIRIAKSKKIETIAEGIETIGQAEILKQSGCDHAQGYFFGKPMPASQFENFLRTRQHKPVNMLQ
ncbi:MAG: putative bifunctional diguanylate cyclase/phosphodiesterase, partial [Huintestinicola sp.]